MSRESESEVVVPGGICTMKTRLDRSRHTSHAQHLYTFVIYYVKTVMNEFSVHPPPPFWFCSKWIIKWNTQQKVVRSTFDMVHWFFSAFLDINHKNTNYFLVYNWSHTAKLNNCRHASPRDFEAYRRNKGRTFTLGLFTALLGEPVTKELKTSPCLGWEIVDWTNEVIRPPQSLLVRGIDCSI